MSVSSVAHFRALVRHVQQSSDPEVKLALSRISAESKERLCDSSPATADFFDSVRQSLSHLKGHANVDKRVGCLYDCAQYFYTIGDTVKAIIAAREGLALAQAAKDA